MASTRRKQSMKSDFDLLHRVRQMGGVQKPSQLILVHSALPVSAGPLRSVERRMRAIAAHHIILRIAWQAVRRSFPAVL